MLNTKVKTGPKTLAGKKRSAQNAIKSGVYATTLLSGEVHSDYKEMRDTMIEDYEAYDALGVSAVEEVVMTYVRKNRITKAETQYLAGVMQTEEAREALCEKLYGDRGLRRVTPWWYLELGPCPEKRTADVIYKALSQLKKFKNKGGYQTDQAFGFAYPELYTVVMWFHDDTTKTIPQTLSALTGKPDMASALEVFEKRIRGLYAKHIEWAENASRYQKVVEMVYAEFAMRVMSKPEMIKLTNALNRQTEHALSVLHARGQLIDVNQTSLTVQVTEPDASVHESTGQSHVTLDNVQDAQPPQDCAAGNVAETRKCEAAKEAQSVAHPNAASETSGPTREVEPAQAAILGEPEPPNLADPTNGDDAAAHPQDKPMGVSNEFARASVTGINRT